MKNQIYTLAVTALMAGTIFTGCQSSDEKVEAAQDKVQEAKQDLKEVQKDANAQADNMQAQKNGQHSRASLK